jgi:hypothetical protein
VLVTITVALAFLAVLAAIVVVAIGGAGELSTEHPDHPPLALPGRRPVAGTDAALLRLPLGLWGYHKQITDEALERFAQELTERDTRIAVLEQELAEARQRLGGGPRQLPAPRTQVDRDVWRHELPREETPAEDDTWSSGWHRSPAEPEDPPTGHEHPPAEYGGWSGRPAENARGGRPGPYGTGDVRDDQTDPYGTSDVRDHGASDVRDGQTGPYEVRDVRGRRTGAPATSVDVPAEAPRTLTDHVAGPEADLDPEPEPGRDLDHDSGRGGDVARGGDGE